jgi:hypothetical protein
MVYTREYRKSKQPFGQLAREEQGKSDFKGGQIQELK